MIESKTPRRLYRWGWLGLFPLIGGVSGLILVIEGVFRYRDWKLAFIGLGGILFTILFYTSLYYYVFYSDINGKGVAKISVVQMNSLKKYIEYYKVQNGSYPEKLELLTISDKLAPVYDPLMSRKNNQGVHLYHYEKLGPSYTLFSCGIDQLPFTDDDLYPGISDSERSKTGLLKQKVH